MPRLRDSQDPLASPFRWSTERLLPEGFLPMLATPASGPLDSDQYAYEVKWEGLRVLAGLESSRLVLRTGTGQDARPWFPELSRLHEACGPDWVVLDGEVLALEQDRPSVPLLQRRLQAGSAEEAARLAEEAPVLLAVSDILRIGDSWLLDVSWEERREILLNAVRNTHCVRVSPVAADGRRAVAFARELGLESVIAKRLRGRYCPGERTRDWLSIKPLEVVEAVICGWTEGKGARAGTIGSLILGAEREDGLAYVGHTGTGITAETLQALHHELTRREQPRSPVASGADLFPDAHWVRPEIRCRVRHQGWTDTGRMRSVTFLGLVEETVEEAAPARPS